MCILLHAFISRDNLIIEFLKHFPYLQTVKTSYLKFLSNMLAMALLWESTVVAVRSQKLSVHIKIIAKNNTHLFLCPLKALTIFVTVMDRLHYCTYVILLAYSAVYWRTK
jgi:hypothetical protein